MTVNFRDWVFEVDQQLTIRTYKQVAKSGAETCICDDCKNYVAYRDKIFPDEVKIFFAELGIDYRKEVEATHYNTWDNGLHNTGGWFHFKGKILRGKDCKVPVTPDGKGFSIQLTKIADNFSIGFTEDNALTFFEDKTGLIQIEFMTDIPWVIDKPLS